MNVLLNLQCHRVPLSPSYRHNKCFELFLVASGKRLLFSNPCFASLSMRQGLTRANLNEHKICLKSFSSTTKSLQEATCKDGENYAKLWTIERGVAIAMVPLVPAAFIFTSPTMDYLVAFTFTLHAHW